MALVRASKASREATRSALGFLVLVAMALIGALVAGPLVRDPVLVHAAQVGADPSAPPQARLDAAAGVFDAADDKGGSGYRFAIVQTSTLHARPDGPKIEIPDPLDPQGSLGFTDSYQLDTAIESGIVTPDGFWMAMRSGPPEGEQPDFEKAPYRYGTLVRDGMTWRNDGDGWYRTDRPPGIGLDPVTAALLPRLLRRATEPEDEGLAPLDAADPAKGELRLVTATGEVADIPGVIAVDGEPFTELSEPIEYAFDDQGRLAKLRVVARNTNHQVFDLVVETVISFDWTSDPGDLPEPKPVWTGADELQVVP